MPSTHLLRPASPWVVCVVCILWAQSAVQATGKEVAMNPLPESKLRAEIRSAHSEFFRKWEGQDFLGAPPFQAGQDGAVVMDFGPEDQFASTDGGHTWHRYEGERTWAPQAFPPVRVGDEWVAVNLDAKGVRRSSDGGLTWGETQPIASATDPRYPDLKGPYVFSIGVTRAGRIIVPEDYLTGREGPDLDVLFANVSADAGRTWRRSAIIEPPDPMPRGPGQLEGFGEPAAVELPDGAIWMVCRASYGQLWQVISRDGGLTWSPPSPTGLASTISNVKASRVPGTDAVVLFWNFAKPGPSRNFAANPSAYRPRAPLVFAVSHDGCKTWSAPTLVYEGTGIYPTIHFTQSEMFVLFVSNPDPGIGSPARYGLTLAVYDTAAVLKQPAWTQETIQPFIDAGLVSHWLAYNIP